MPNLISLFDIWKNSFYFITLHFIFNLPFIFCTGPLFLFLIHFYYHFSLPLSREFSNEVLSFVNTIAEIVHSKVHSWRGQCNKNLGTLFVLSCTTLCNKIWCIEFWQSCIIHTVRYTTLYYTFLCHRLLDLILVCYTMLCYHTILKYAAPSAVTELHSFLSSPTSRLSFYLFFAILWHYFTSPHHRPIWSTTLYFPLSPLSSSLSLSLSLSPSLPLSLSLSLPPPHCISQEMPLFLCGDSETKKPSWPIKEEDRCQSEKYQHSKPEVKIDQLYIM